MLRLTQKASDQDFFYVAPAHIQLVQPADTDRPLRSRVVLANGLYYDVREAPEDILKMCALWRVTRDLDPERNLRAFLYIDADGDVCTCKFGMEEE
jgi:hypothetical protein